jgi:hypothetical protein
MKLLDSIQRIYPGSGDVSGSGTSNGSSGTGGGSGSGGNGFDATPEEHAIMIQYYLNAMVASLIEMNGGVGVYEDFVGLVLIGFPAEVYSYIGLTTAEVVSLYSDYLNATTGQGNINHILSNCN